MAIESQDTSGQPLSILLIPSIAWSGYPTSSNLHLLQLTSTSLDYDLAPSCTNVARSHIEFFHRTISGAL